jgi:hypothetical protein
MSRMPLRAASCLVAAVFALSGSGCSWAFVQKAPDPVMAPTYPISCTDSKAAPVLDTICAGYFVANGLVWAGSDDEANKGTGVAVSAGFLALCALSAMHGYGATSRCEQVKSLNAMCITGDEAACRSLRPGWTPPQRLPAAPAIPAPAPAPQ